MYCSRCGKQIEDGSRFCKECGANLSGGSQNPMPSITLPTVNMENQDPAYLGMMAMGCVSGIAGLFPVIGVGSYSFNIFKIFEFANRAKSLLGVSDADAAGVYLIIFIIIGGYACSAYFGGKMIYELISTKLKKDVISYSKYSSVCAAISIIVAILCRFYINTSLENDFFNLSVFETPGINYIVLIGCFVNMFVLESRISRSFLNSPSSTTSSVNYNSNSYNSYSRSSSSNNYDNSETIQYLKRPSGEMVVCNYCGSQYRSNPYGCTFCHKGK